MARALRVTRVLMVTLLMLIATSAGPAHALSLLGAEVTGEFFVNGGTTNYFDPENLKVPDGFGNSNNPPGNASNIVPIQDPLVEFGYRGASDTFTAQFTGAGGVTIMATGMPFTTVTMNFTSPGFTGLSFAPVSIGGSNNNCSFASITITCGVTAGPGFTSTYGFSSPARVPAPATLTLLALGLTGLIARWRRRQ